MFTQNATLKIPLLCKGLDRRDNLIRNYPSIAIRSAKGQGISLPSRYNLISGDIIHYIPKCMRSMTA